MPLMKKIVKWSFYGLSLFIILTLCVSQIPRTTTISGVSMHPTYSNHEKIKTEFVNITEDLKRYSPILAKLDNAKYYPSYVFDESCPKLIDHHSKCYNKQNLEYAKRIIGMPGDSLKIKDEVIYINGEKEQFNPKDYTSNDSPFNIPRIIEEDKIKNHDYKYKISPNGYKVAFHKSVLKREINVPKIPEGHYFIVGDNRNLSGDSRDFGLVKREEIVKHLEVR